MTKREFTVRLGSMLSGLPKRDIDERISFYCEMIDDKIEDGMSEEEAVANLGSIEDIAAEIREGVPLVNLVKEKFKPKRGLSAWEIVLLVLGSPIWLSLLVAAVAIVFSLYAVLWSAVLSLWAVFVSLAAVGVAGTASGVILIFTDGALTGLVLISGSLVSAGISILAFYGCRAASVGAFYLTKNSVPLAKRMLSRSGIERTRF